MERTSFQAVRDSQQGREVNMGRRNPWLPFESGLRPRGLEDDQVRAVAIDGQFGGDRGDQPEVISRILYLADGLPGTANFFRKTLFGFCPKVSNLWGSLSNAKQRSMMVTRSRVARIP